MSDQSLEISFYLEQYHMGHSDDAFHGLLELSGDAVPELVNVYRASTDTSIRAILLKVICHYQQPVKIPLLAEALNDHAPEIWKEAIDGLVAIASPESLQLLQTARMRQFADARMGRIFSEWLEEAITQVAAQLKSFETELPP